MGALLPETGVALRLAEAASAELFPEARTAGGTFPVRAFPAGVFPAEESSPCARSAAQRTRSPRLIILTRATGVDARGWKNKQSGKVVDFSESR